MSTPANREQFVKQLETIVDGIRNNLSRVCSTQIFNLNQKNFN